MPIGAAELAVGDRVEPDLLLPGDDLADLGVLDGGKLGGGDSPRRVLEARLLKRRGTQDRADMIGAERREVALHGGYRSVRRCRVSKGARHCISISAKCGVRR